jgi:DNA-binding NarL/FixJ family response regulator
LAYSSHTFASHAPAPESRPPIRVLLAIPSRLERLGWSIVIRNQNDLQLVGDFGSFAGALAFLRRNPADVALIDEALLAPKHCERLREEAARLGCRILLVAKHPLNEEPDYSRYSFASACLLKGISASDLLSAIRG